MDKTRILPPLVRGRVTGVLDFFVDEIRLFRNILLLTDNFDLVLQVQWWGEILPALIRPKELRVEGKNNKNHHLLQSYYHSAQYEIKTTLDLFKAYLKNCEVLELSVFEVFDNYVIGSAFLKDLINVLYSNNELIRMPIFDYLGEEIGEVIIHVNFLHKSNQDKGVIRNKSTEIFKSNDTDKMSDKLGSSTISSKIKSDSFTLGEKTISYDGHSRKNLHEKVAITDAGLPFNFNKNENTSHCNLSSTISSTGNKLFSSSEGVTNSKFIKEGRKPSLPEVQTVTDASKVLYFGHRSKHKTDIKKPKMTNKFNSNSIKCKSKQPEKSGIVSSYKTSLKSIPRKPEGGKNLGKNLTKPIIEKEIDLKSSSTCSGPVKSEIQPLHESVDLRNIPSKQSPNVKVLDYLLGSDMSKDDEYTALNDFKKMSPSRNLVDSINQLCLAPDKVSQKPVNMYSTNSPASLRKNLLNFDFTNPIERNYYEKFFSKSNCPPDFEIAELLNQPDSNPTLERLENPKNRSPISSLKNSSKSSCDKWDTKGEEADDWLVNVSLPDRKNSCSRCKYYKKLNELDTIIESLKHFEQKMVSHEKDLQSALKENSDKLINRNHL